MAIKVSILKCKVSHVNIVCGKVTNLLHIFYGVSYNNACVCDSVAWEFTHCILF